MSSLKSATSALSKLVILALALFVTFCCVKSTNALAEVSSPSSILVIAMLILFYVGLALEIKPDNRLSRIRIACMLPGAVYSLLWCI